MKKHDAISYFGTLAELAKALGIRVQSTYSWSGDFVPEHHARRLSSITLDRLQFDEAFYERIREQRRTLSREYGALGGRGKRREAAPARRPRSTRTKG